MTRLPPEPELTWTDGDTPESAAVGDVYFSRDGGFDESRRVFLDGCGLPEGWRGRRRFVIGELGFGTGLNALAAWDLWRRTRADGAILHMLSVEAAPMDAESARRALSPFTEAAPLAQALLARWPVRARAPQRLWFPQDGFALTLFVGEAESVLARLDAAVDAWFLDGFAPSRNPAMWSPAVMAQLARLSAPGARVATYTVAGAVRTALSDVGFAVEKRPGFGRKRERLEARLHSPPAPRRSAFPTAPSDGLVVILGAGVAGASIAAALRRRGRDTLVIDAARSPAEGASGNPVGLVMPRLDRGSDAASGFLLAAYLHALAFYRSVGPPIFEPTGVLERAETERERVALSDFACDPPLPAELFAVVADTEATHPQAGIARPRALVARLLDSVPTRFEADAHALTRGDDGWTVRDARGDILAEAGAVVIACGPALARFTQTRWLPLALSRGQLDWAQIDGEAPRHAIAMGAYCAPADEAIYFGATFDPWSDDARPPAPDEASTARNIANLARLAPDLAARIRPQGARAALRATTPDRLPVCGLLPEAHAYRERFAGLAQGRPLDLSAPPPAHEGLYVLGGLGSRGLTFAPLLAERLASEICGEPPPLDRPALEAIHPARFLLRALRRRQSAG